MCCVQLIFIVEYSLDVLFVWRINKWGYISSKIDTPTSYAI